MAMKNKDEIINISKAAINSLELDNINRTNTVISCRDIKNIKKKRLPTLIRKLTINRMRTLPRQ